MDQRSSNTFYIIDGSSYIFRAYYGLTQRLLAADGTPTNAVFGVKNMLGNIVKEYNPKYLALIFDAGKRTVRHEMYEAYKANRGPAPDDLVPQFSLIYEMTKLMNFTVIRIEGIEADDVIGTLARQFGERTDVRIFSGDKDLMQLIGPRVKMIDSMKNKTFDSDAVKEKFGVLPEQIADFLALVGDSSDNIPGAKGIGNKGAAELLAKYADIQTLKKHLPEIKGKRGEKLRESWDRVELSLRLTTIDRHIDLSSHIDNPTSPETYLVQSPQDPALRKLYNRLNFKDDVFLKNQAVLIPEETPTLPSVEKKQYVSICDADALKKAVEQMATDKLMCVDLETNSPDRLSASIVGVAIASDGCPAAYIPIRHVGAGAQLALEDVLAALSPLFENPDMRLVCHNLKFDLGILRRSGVVFKCAVEDTMLMSYLIDAESHSHGLDKLAEKLLNHTMVSFEDVVGKGKNQVTFDKIDIDVATRYAAEDADITLKLYHILEPRLREMDLRTIYDTLEIPLSAVLENMENVGIRIDESHFFRLRNRWSGEMAELEKNIYRVADVEFNINSPKQLSDILFNKMGIQEHVKKNKTGISTNAAVLEKLAPKYEIASLILHYRTLAKLVNTYVDKLPLDINPVTRRIHTSFNQTVAATGRLSSNNPNLQNIPIKGKEGVLIREGFVSRSGYVFLSADYSQIELRVLAHLSNDTALIEAFGAGKDIHAETAMSVFSLRSSEVTADYRRLAKAINFGIVYGMGAFRLAQSTGISHVEAKRFIDMYFSQFSSIQGYITDTVRYAREHGYVKTILGRKRSLADINNRNAHVRKASERIAVNTTIQGSAADIIKKAMIGIHQTLRHNRYQSRMLLQVHDELVFEVEENEIEPVKKMIVDKMTHALPLNVPLSVSCHYGKNWEEAHG